MAPEARGAAPGFAVEIVAERREQRRRGEPAAEWTWNLATGHRIAALPPLDRPLLHMRFNTTGDRFVAVEAYSTNTIRVWAAATGQPLGILRGHENQLNSLAFSADGTQMVTASTRTMPSGSCSTATTSTSTARHRTPGC